MVVQRDVDVDAHLPVDDTMVGDGVDAMGQLGRAVGVGDRPGRLVDLGQHQLRAGFGDQQADVLVRHSGRREVAEVTERHGDQVGRELVTADHDCRMRAH